MRDGVNRTDQCREQVLDLVAGEGNQAARGQAVTAFGGCGDGKEGVGEHREGDPPVP